MASRLYWIQMQSCKEYVINRHFLIEDNKGRSKRPCILSCETIEDMTRAAKDLHAQGVENVMVLDLDGNAILACKEGTSIVMY